MGIASLGLALSANAANVNLGAAGGALVFDPAEITIKSGETVTWTNKIGFPHNVVFDEDGIPVSTPSLHLACKHLSRAVLPHVTARRMTGVEPQAQGVAHDAVLVIHHVRRT